MGVIAPALVLIAVAMLLVRIGWAGRRGVAATGWALVAGALLLLATEAGAWGLAMGTVIGIVAAILIVLHAGWTAPHRMRRASRAEPAVALPRGAAQLARRVSVFLLVVPCAFIAAQWLAFGVQALARRTGASEPDAIVLTLFLQPLLWGGLMAWQMTRPTASAMIAPPVGAAILGTMLWSLS